MQGVQPRAVLNLEVFGRGAVVRAGGAIRHILDRDGAADPIYFCHHSGPHLLGKRRRADDAESRGGGHNHPCDFHGILPAVGRLR